MAKLLRLPSPPEPVDPLDRSEAAVRQRLSEPALRSFFNICSEWSLNVAEQRSLLGWPPASTFHKYKSGSPGTLPYDMLIRISLVLGIYKALHILYPDPGLANAWPKLPNTNPLFGGRPALHLMTEAGIDGLLQVRRLLDARRG